MTEHTVVYYAGLH
jgi:hypothetical protein